MTGHSHGQAHTAVNWVASGAASDHFGVKTSDGSGEDVVCGGRNKQVKVAERRQDTEN